MHHSLTLATLALLAHAVLAQQPGTLTTETHPHLAISNCTATGCTTASPCVTLDADWRWLHANSSSTNCYTENTLDATLCPDPETCATNCALDGGDDAGTYGITTEGDSLPLGFITGSNAGSRNYLMAADGADEYEMLRLKNREFAFDVDVSNLPCGLNGALYLVEMDQDGGLSEYDGNNTGAKYGTGYCDAQYPQDIKFINGEANILDWTPSENNPNTGTGSHGSCYNEMDIWEVNSISNAETAAVSAEWSDALVIASYCRTYR